MRKFIGSLIVLTAMVGLCLACNESADKINVTGLFLFGLAALIGANHKRIALWVKAKYNYYIEYINFWRS